MEKQKRWQLILIVAVLLLTIYNILPTVFYYTKPLHSPINTERAESVADNAISRINALEDDAKEWLASFSKLLDLKAKSISLNENNPGFIDVSFNTQKDADKFRMFLTRAGTLIPFAPSQLEPHQGTSVNPETVTVARQISIHLNPEKRNKLFQFTNKVDGEKIAPLYRNLVNDRAAELALAFTGPSKTAEQISLFASTTNESAKNDLTLSIAKEIVDIDTLFGKTNKEIASRYYSNLLQGANKDAMKDFSSQLETLLTNLNKEQTALTEAKKDSGDSRNQQSANLLKNQIKTLETASRLIKNNNDQINSAKDPLSAKDVASLLEKETAVPGKIQILSLEGRNPFVESLAIDWDNSRIQLKLFDDVKKIRESDNTSETTAVLKDKLGALVINDIAKAARIADENIVPFDNTYAVSLNNLIDSKSFLTLNLGAVASEQAKQIENQLNASWNPQNTDLVRSAYPIYDYSTYLGLKPEDQKLGLIIYAPAANAGDVPQGFRKGSIYVIARGLGNISEKYQQSSNKEAVTEYQTDLNALSSLLQQNGFIGYPGSSFGMAKEFNKDFIFELSDYYSNLLKASREDFAVKGSKRYAVLDFTDVEQRILTLNKIDDRIQEDLLKWKEEYDSAQVDLNASGKYLVPALTKNPYWENFKISFVKFFRGDDRKILKWGLDLSGGKTVRIGLRDHNNKPVTDPDDLKQAVNELYTRINKMGVSERTIHIENNNIVLDFPGSQNLSASELVKASAMYFHIVNEKFTPGNADLKNAVNNFLQGVWNEAVVTNRKDIESINDIAWQHLGGESLAGNETRPQSDDAKVLFENGLRIMNPKERNVSSAFDDTLSAIAMMRGSDFMEWDGQSHPLLVVFHNFALEGSSLENVQVGYDASQGNILSFGIKRSFDGAKDRGSPRDDFYAWTSQFAEDKIAGTAKEAFSHGKGWRMAVILNGQTVSKPTLNAALRDGGVISGRFSQREINQLAADLKAGSLSFTPKILSEQNVSPELGKEDRNKGIFASIVAVILIVAAMVGYYRFAGLVASCAVLLNLLIIWGVLQNIDAALTLPLIAGIVLTIGMAVDANVLVFERVREEFKISGRIASAIQTGYRKAFSAIIDSNITTIIVALILLQFDSGPIRGFAVTLIIGIISSMFTALFMTRYFFAGWIQNPKNKKLNMAKFIGNTKFDFMGQTKKAMAITAIVLVLGTYFFVSQRNTLLGMDFTGGYSLVVDLEEKKDVTDYRESVAKALLDKGATSNDFQLRELSRPNQVRIQFGISMEQKDHPFYQMPETAENEKAVYPYQSIPRLEWVVNALQTSGLNIQEAELATLDNDWTVMSGQFSETMRDNAIIGLSLALLSILLYIALRFDFQYAIGAVVGLLHDVLITVGILALFHKMGLPVQIDLQVIAAIMTIIGYSLNDTIIVFDRIREDSKLLRKMKFIDVINEALNVTLSRTIITSGTTLLVLLALVFLGGKSIFAFSLVMTIGVVVGTLSSLFIAAPVMYYFHQRELLKDQQHEGNLKKA